MDYVTIALSIVEGGIALLKAIMKQNNEDAAAASAQLQADLNALASLRTQTHAAADAKLAEVEAKIAADDAAGAPTLPSAEVTKPIAPPVAPSQK